MTIDNLSPERKDFLGRGWAMPVQLDPRTGLVASVAYEEDIRQSMRIILETAPGERVMRPNFGCGIHELVFTAVDSTAIQRIRSVVDEALRRCEARIEVLSINVNEDATSDASVGPPDEGRLLVVIDYRVRKTNQTGNLVFPFYFHESSASATN
jgi:Bacteriophage baseplate protein W